MRPQVKQKIENILNQQSLSLHTAIINGDIEEVKNYIEEGVSIDREYNDTTPLTLAIEGNKLEIIKLLIEENLKDNSSYYSSNHENFLKLAIKGNNIEITKYLLEKAQTIDKNIDCSSALNIAAEQNNIEMVKYFIDLGANTEIKNQSGKTPLASAAHKGNVEIVELLLKNGANIETKIGSFWDMGYTPLMLAVKENNFEMVTYLINNKANIEARDVNENTSLSIATEENHTKIVELLLKNNANTEVINSVKERPLMIAIKQNNIEIAELLIKNMANVEASNYKNKSPLMIAIEEDKVEMAKCLIEGGADIKAYYYDKTILMLAIEKNNMELVKYLVEKGLKNLQEDCHSNKSLILAIKQNNLEMVKYLIEKGIDINVENYLHQTALTVTIQQQGVNEEIIEFLIKSIAQEVIEKEFIITISGQDPNNLRHIFINNGVNIEKAFTDNSMYINWHSSLVKEYALKINCRYSNIIKDLSNENMTIDQYKECFYQAKELKKTWKDDLIIDQIMMSVFLKASNEHISKLIISELVKETQQSEHKELVKWLTIFGAKFSFYNSDKILLTSQPQGNESKNYNIELNEEEFPDEFINFKKITKVEIRDGKLYNVHTGDIINGGEDHHFLYVIDKKGQLYIDINEYNIRHSYILNGYNQKHSLDGISMFGYGKPIRCGGHLQIKDGVITEINNDSGHYHPDENMLMQTYVSLLDLGILDMDSICDYAGNVIDIKDVRFDIEQVIALGNYDFLDY